MRTLIREQLGSNDSVCRIHSELSADSDSTTWYDNNNSEPPFKIWCLDDPEQNKPSAEFDGIAVLATPSAEPTDTMFTKRSAALLDFDERLSRAKRRRTKDVSPYEGLVNKEGYLHLLNEFVPPPLAQRLVEKIPWPTLRKILKTIRTLTQEYRYVLLDRIIRNEIYDLPQVATFEELERAMIAHVAEKLSATFTLRFDQGIDDCAYSDMTIKISGYALNDFDTDISSAGCNVQVCLEFEHIK